MIAGFHHLAIQVNNLEGAARFYCEVIGMKERVRHLRLDGTLRAIWLDFPTGAGFLALEETADPPVPSPFRSPEPGFHLLAFRIAPEERRPLMSALQQRGIAILHETRWSFYFADPEGNRLAFSHHPFEPV